jgi:membrane protein implicated in regulation of membrane protease activity
MNPYYVCIIAWIVIIVAAIVIEVSTIALTSVWFAVGGIVALLLAIFNVEFVWQLLTFVGVSTISLLATRPIAKKMNTKDVIHTNADKLINMIGVVTKEIPVSEVGEIRVNSELWRAKSLEAEDIEVGEKVIVNNLDGNKLIVSRIKKNDEIEIL